MPGTRSAADKLNPDADSHQAGKTQSRAASQAESKQTGKGKAPESARGRSNRAPIRRLFRLCTSDAFLTSLIATVCMAAVAVLGVWATLIVGDQQTKATDRATVIARFEARSTQRLEVIRTLRDMMKTFANTVPAATAINVEYYNVRVYQENARTLDPDEVEPYWTGHTPDDIGMHAFELSEKLYSSGHYSAALDLALVSFRDALTDEETLTGEVNGIYEAYDALKKYPSVTNIWDAADTLEKHLSSCPRLSDVLQNPCLSSSDDQPDCEPLPFGLYESLEYGSNSLKWAKHYTTAGGERDPNLILGAGALTTAVQRIADVYYFLALETMRNELADRLRVYEDLDDKIQRLDTSTSSE